METGGQAGLPTEGDYSSLESQYQETSSMHFNAE